MPKKTTASYELIEGDCRPTAPGKAPIVIQRLNAAAAKGAVPIAMAVNDQQTAAYILVRTQ